MCVYVWMCTRVRCVCMCMRVHVRSVCVRIYIVLLYLQKLHNLDGIQLLQGLRRLTISNMTLSRRAIESHLSLLKRLEYVDMQGTKIEEFDYTCLRYSFGKQMYYLVSKFTLWWANVLFGEQMYTFYEPFCILSRI